MLSLTPCIIQISPSHLKQRPGRHGGSSAADSTGIVVLIPSPHGVLILIIYDSFIIMSISYKLIQTLM